MGINFSSHHLTNVCLARFGQLLCRWATLFSLAVLLTGADAKADSLRLNFVDGRVLAVELQQSSLDWTHVQDNGETNIKRINFSDIQTLVLSDAPAAKQIATVRQLINQLGSDSYAQREAAEKKLTDPDFAGPHFSLIEEFADDPRLEVQFRVRRALNKLEDQRRQANIQFDQLTLKSGETMQGDAGDFKWRVKFQDKTIAVDRAEIRLIRAMDFRPPTTLPQWAQNAQANSGQGTNVKLFHDFESFKTEFRDQNLTNIDFSTAPDGKKLAWRDNVNDTFIPLGLRFAPTGKGYVGIPRFSFPGSGYPVGDQAIARFNDDVRRRSNYKGLVEFEFCMADQPTVPAGVHCFGTFIATVSYPRSFVLEAYNSLGDLVGSVETKESRCGFIGIESDEPICRIRVRANPHLFRVDEKTDEDYALDSFYFSPPVEQRSIASASNAKDMADQASLVVLKDGNRLVGDVSFLQNKIAIQTKGLVRFELTAEEISEVQLASEFKIEKSNWLASLVDGSMLIFTPEEQLTAKIDNQPIDIDQMVSLHHSSNERRYPLAGDFEDVSSVIVFPSCRIPTDKVDLNVNGFRWDESAEKRLQPVDEESPLGIPGTDPTPQVSEVDFKTTTPENIPTIWLKRPVRPSTGSGLIHLVDGQRIVFRKDTAEITWSKKSITLMFRGKKLNIAIDQVKVIRL